MDAKIFWCKRGAIINRSLPARQSKISQSFAGVPPQAWDYRLGSRSALEWILDQYKERKPRDPTIREQFNTYRFADHKERVIDLLGRVCAVSAFTTTVVKELSTR